MKIKLIIILLSASFMLNSCWIGDTDDTDILYGTTLIKELCQTQETSDFCSLVYRTTPIASGRGAGTPIVAWILQFSGRDPIDPSGVACVSSVESVFAPSNEAFDKFLENFPHWDSVDDIPQDSVDLIVKHHVHLNAKLFIELSEGVCAEEEIVPGSASPYQMMYGEWIFARSPQNPDEIRPLSQNTFEFTQSAIITPDISSTDGVVYILDKVLGPFLN